MASEVNASAQYNMRFLWLICLVAAMGGLLFGYDWVVIGGAKPFYEPFFGISDSSFLQGLAMSSALIGCLFGALISGALTDRFGRKRLLILAGLLFTLSAIGTAKAWDFTWFNLFRWIGGVGIGLASNLSPMYIAEISPAATRGRFVSINQLTIVIGILAAQIVNLMIAAPVPTADQVRLLIDAETAERVISDGGLDFSSLKTEASAMADPEALAAVEEAFPEIAYVRLGEDASKEEKTARSDEDAAIMAAYLGPTWNGQMGWRWMFGAETVPAFLFFLLMFFVPESPRWLAKYGRDKEALRTLARIGGQAHAEAELADIRATLAREEIARVNFRDLLEPRLVKIIGLGVFLAVFQQWCGINVIFNYAQEVFQAAGYEVGDLMFSIVITGIVNLAFTFVAIFTVDRFGRRMLMLIGAGGLAGIYAILGTGFYQQSTGIHMLILVVTAIACYSMSLAPVTWVVIAEIFPNRIRGAAMSIAVFSLWVGCTALTFTFPFLKETLGAHGAFWLYGAICVVGFVVIWKKLPETKGKSLEDIERQLVD
ncbi:MAG: sugar porter family MFS transporter [Planctomycetota bacterium]|jgi:MFS family permease